MAFLKTAGTRVAGQQLPNFKTLGFIMVPVRLHEQVVGRLFQIRKGKHLSRMVYLCRALIGRLKTSAEHGSAVAAMVSSLA